MNKVYQDIKTFVEDMKKGVYDYTDNGKCTNCGSCCGCLLPMTQSEVKALKYYVKRMKIKLTERRMDVDFDMTCPFRDDDKKICRVYNVRPLICRDFKCDKPSKSGKMNPEFDRHNYYTVNLREVFGV